MQQLFLRVIRIFIQRYEKETFNSFVQTLLTLGVCNSKHYILLCIVYYISLKYEILLIFNIKLKYCYIHD